MSSSLKSLEKLKGDQTEQVSSLSYMGHISSSLLPFSIKYIRSISFAVHFSLQFLHKVVDKVCGRTFSFQSFGSCTDVVCHPFVRNIFKKVMLGCSRVVCISSRLTTLIFSLRALSQDPLVEAYSNFFSSAVGKNTESKQVWASEVSHCRLLPVSCD